MPCPLVQPSVPSFDVIVRSDRLTNNGPAAGWPQSSIVPSACGVPEYPLQGWCGGAFFQPPKHADDFPLRYEWQGEQQTANVTRSGIFAIRDHLLLLIHSLGPVERTATRQYVGQDILSRPPHGSLEVEDELLDCRSLWQDPQHILQHLRVVSASLAAHQHKQEWHLLQIVAALQKRMDADELLERLLDDEEGRVSIPETSPHRD